MIKAGIITFHNGSNYGAVLQTFSLQKAIEEFGIETHIINYSNPFISKGLRPVRYGGTFLYIFFTIFDLVHLSKNIVKIKKFRKFFFERYNLTQLQDSTDLKSARLNYEIGISGGDQIWNPLLNKGLDDIYFLNFGAFKRKISYSSSLGAYQYNIQETNNSIKRFLCDYKRISVRENPDKLENIIGKKVYEVCDPTLLIDKNKWSECFQLVLSEDNYLLVYALSDFEKVLNIGRRIASSKHLSVICIGKQLKTHHDVKYVLDAGPEDFVNLFYNASYIVTNSFHGTAFSVNFQKQFVSVRHQKSPERAESFLHRVGLSCRLVDVDNFLSVITDITGEEYASSSDRLDRFRRESLSFLKDACLNED